VVGAVPSVLIQEDLVHPRLALVSHLVECRDTRVGAHHGTRIQLVDEDALWPEVELDFVSVAAWHCRADGGRESGLRSRKYSTLRRVAIAMSLRRLRPDHASSVPPFPTTLVRTWQLLSLALAVAVVFLVRAEYAGAPAQVYLFKPLATILVMALTFPLAWGTADPYARFVLGGLVCSLAGDVFLMLPSDRFVAGLASFLVAHLFYVAAFTRDGGFSRGSATALPLVAIGAIVLSLLWPLLGPLRLPVLAYMLVILVMAWQALERSRLGAHDGAWWGAVGAVLFVASDSSLGLARFRGDFPGSRALILVTYYLAQWMIATSALVRAGRLAR